MNNYYILSILFLSFSSFLSAQNVGIGTNFPDASAKVDIFSSNTGLLIPRVSIGSASVFGLSGGTSTPGIIVFNTNAGTTGGQGIGFYFWNAGTWNYIANGDVLDASLDNGKIWIGDASNNPIERNVNGDASMSNTGLLDLNIDAVETDEIINNAVDGTKIQLTGNANGDLMYYNGTDWVRLAAGTSGQILRTNGAAAPTWNNPTDVLIFRNGLTEMGPNIVELGGTLTKNTTITQGAFQMTYNLSGSGDFNVQDNGVNMFQVLDNGRVEMSGTTDASGATNSGVLEIANALRIDGNEIITNTDAILYINTNNNGDVQMDEGTFYVDASEDRIGVGLTTGLTQKLDVAGNVDVNNGTYYLRDNVGTTYGMGYNTEGGSQLTIFSDDIIQFTESDADVVAVHITTNSRRMGINNTTPSTTLDVNGTVRIRGGAPGVGKVLMANNANGTAAWATSGYGLVPIGSIVAWHKNGGGIPALPAGWRECNGGSFGGITIPNLNGNTTSTSGDGSLGRFLRGGTTSGTLQNDRSNNLDWVNHDDTGNGDAEESLNDDGTATTIRNYSTSGDRFQIRVEGVETRVTNMSVVWIIRVE